MTVLQAAGLFSLLVIVVRANSTNLLVLHPLPNSHAAPITTTITIDFPAAIDPSAISTRTIPIYSAQHGLLAGAYTVDDTLVVMTPTRSFFSGELVQGVVTTHTLNLSGTAQAAPTVWQFRTAVDASSGTFLYHQSGLDSEWSEDVSLGDLDGDGDLDILLGNRDEAASVWLNDGFAHFNSNGMNLGSAFLIDVSLGDLDGDGDLDAILAGIQDNSLWWNDGHGAFSFGGDLFPGSAIIRRVVLGDLNGDGYLDAITVTSCEPFDPNQYCDYAVNRIWWNDGTGVFQPSSQTLGHGTSADLSLGDLDRDGDLDAMVVRDIVKGGAVWMNMGGTFTVTQTFDDLNAASVDLGDLDGDGDLDAFMAAQTSETSAVWLNDGHGVLSPGKQLGHLGPARLGDLDGDGDLDVFSVIAGAENVWLNQGDAGFHPSGQNLGLTSGTNVALGDLDADGDLDAITNGYNEEPSLWFNQTVFGNWFPWVSQEP